MHAYVCVVCTCGVCACTPVCVRVEDRGRRRMSYSVTLYLVPLRQPLTESARCFAGRLASQQVPAVFPAPPLLTLLEFSTGAWGWRNTQLFTWTQIPVLMLTLQVVFPTEPSP